MPITTFKRTNSGLDSDELKQLFTSLALYEEGLSWKAIEERIVNHINEWSNEAHHDFDFVWRYASQHFKVYFAHLDQIRFEALPKLSGKKLDRFHKSLLKTLRSA